MGVGAGHGAVDRRTQPAFDETRQASEPLPVVVPHRGGCFRVGCFADRLVDGAAVPGYKPGTGKSRGRPSTILNDVRSRRTWRRIVLDPEDRRIVVRRNERHVLRCATCTRDLHRAIAAFDEHSTIR